MPRFVILDHTLRDLLGHHYEYSVSVAEAAARKGLEPIILAHISFPPSLTPEGIRIIPLFPYGWFEAPPPPPPPYRERRLKLYIKFAVYVLTRRSGWWRDRAQRSIPRLRRLQQQLRVSRSLRLLRAVTLTPARKALRAVYGTPSRVRNLFRKRLPATARTFAAALRQAMDDLELGPEDHVFFHTFRVEQLEELLDAIQSRRPSTLPHFHLLMRRDYEEPFIRFASGLGLLRILEIFHSTRLWPHKASFYTDTDELTEQYNALTRVRFVTAPIPFRHELIHDAPPYTEPDRPLTVLYLGDARYEKGYQLLPNAVDALYDPLCTGGKLKFLLQSYVQPSNVGEMRDAFNRLAQYPAQHVELIPEQVSPERYYALLAQGDVVVIPYLAEQYLRRSSGILTEALAAGKPVVVGADTWMAAQIDESRGAVYAEPSGIAAAIRTVAEDYEAKSASAQAFVESWRKKHSPDALLNCLLSTAGPGQAMAAAQTEAPRVLYVMDADPFAATFGSSMVARTQLQYLADCGYRVYGVFVSVYGQQVVVHDPSPFLEQVEAGLRFLPLERKWVISNAHGVAGLGASLSSFVASRAQEYSLKRDCDLRWALALPESLTQLVKDEPIDLVLVNYIFNWPIVERLGLTGIPIVCETIDIQAFQYAMYGNRLVSEDEIRAEAQLLDRCDAVITINRTEEARLAAYIDPGKLVTAGFFVDVEPISSTELQGFTGLPELIHSAGCNRDDIHLDRSLATGQRTQIEGMRDQDRMDLLFVSAAHVPNIESFTWFYHHVFAPFLAPKGVNLFVAGSIDRAIPWALDAPNVFLLGRVDNLRPLYAATRLVALPIQKGAGLAIKTVEALAYGKPIVATSVAMRSLPYDQHRFPVFDAPEAFADEVLRLLKDPDARMKNAKEAFAIGREHSKQHHHMAYDQVLVRLLGERARPAPVGERSEQEISELCEWSPEVRIANVIEANAEHLPSVLHPASEKHRAFLAGFDDEGWTGRNTARAFLAFPSNGSLQLVVNVAAADDLAGKQAITVVVNQRRVEVLYPSTFPLDYAICLPGDLKREPINTVEFQMKEAVQDPEDEGERWVSARFAEIRIEPAAVRRKAANPIRQPAG